MVLRGAVAAPAVWAQEKGVGTGSAGHVGSRRGGSQMSALV